jgi:chromosome segregation ATPase
MSARGNGGTYHYYACTSRQKYGPKSCRGDRLPRHKLEDAVLRQLAEIYRDGQLIHDALAHAREQAAHDRPALDERLASIRAEITRAERSIERYLDAFEQGKLSPDRCDERLGRLQSRLADLRAQEAELAETTTDDAADAPTTADLAAAAQHLEDVIADAQPERAKALLRLLIAELRVNSKTDIQPIYRIITPTVCATSGKVETVGIEPTSAVA